MYIGTPFTGELFTINVTPKEQFFKFIFSFILALK